MRAGNWVVVAGLTLAVCHVASAENLSPRIAVVHTGTSHQALFAVAMRDDVGVAVGADGEVQETADAGQSWKETAPPTTAALLGVILLPQCAVAVGQAGVIVRRDTSGKWTTIESRTTDRLFAVAANESGLVVAVGAFGTILKSVDYGEHWAAIAPEWSAYTPQGEEPHLYAVQVGVDGAITIAGEFGLILRTDAEAKAWEPVHKGEASLFALQLRPDGQGYAVGQSGAVLRTDDNGSTWKALDARGSANAIYLGVRSLATGRVIVVGMHDLLVSDDHGASWMHLGSDRMGAQWYAGLAAGGPEAPAFAVGVSGRIARLSN